MKRTGPTRLKSATIIPADLYVPRAADSQLADVISDMGRPAYVLVARQMGKTNLLINMKRLQEMNGEGVVYIDFSGRSESLAGCLRGIIDIALDTIRGLSGGLPDVIAEVRQKNLDPRLEYESSLRAILNDRPTSKLIIILDEVDSLTSCPYSDNVFALVRSMYFSRVNYREFERLTYVLSGVADPIDLIKDKAISPFNIGEKIFLSDFTQEQFRKFLRKAELDVSKETLDRIFHWSCGNPRITWDVCSALEPLARQRVASAADVDAAVKRLYLESYDRPPVDHIRELVKSDTQLISAARSIMGGHGEQLSAKQKSRLYLSGITNSIDALSPKNPIIAAAISQDWLAEIGEFAGDPLSVARTSFTESKWHQVVNVVEDFIEGTGSDLPLDLTLAYGVSLYNLGQFERAAVVLSGEEIPDVGDEAGIAAYYAGSSLLHLSRPADSRRYLSKAVDLAPVQFALSGKCLLGSSYLEEDPNRYESEVENLSAEVIDALLEASESVDDAERILTVAYYNAAWCAKIRGDNIESGNRIERALSYASPAEWPEVFLFKIGIVQGTRQEEVLLSEAADHILKNRLQPSVGQANSLTFKTRTLADIACLLCVHSRYDQLDELLRHSLNAMVVQRTALDVLVVLFEAIENAGRASAGVSLLRRAASVYMTEEVTDSQCMYVFRQLAKYEIETRREHAVDRFLSEVDLRVGTYSPIEDDFTLIFTEISQMLTVGRHERGLRMSDTVTKMARLSTENAAVLTAIAHYYRMLIHRVRGDITLARSIAQSVLEGVKEGSAGEFEAERMGLLEQIRTQAISTLRLREPDPFAGIQRNQKVVVRDPISGTCIESKFKFVEERLKTGELELAGVVGRKPRKEQERKPF